MAQGVITRAATAKWQEDPVGSLLEMLQEQKQRQETLAAEQVESINCLTASVQEQYHRTSEWQRETESRVDRLQEDLRGVGEMLQERLKSAEDSLEEMQSFQEQLRCSQTEKLQELHQMVLGLGEVKLEEAAEKKPASLEVKSDGKSSLRIDALEFAPLEYLEEPADTGGAGTGEPDIMDEGVARRPMHKPSVYDGKTPWEAYSTQFEMLASLNHWTQAEKATYLAVSLRGSALTVLTNLTEVQRGNYTTLTTALKNRYGTGHQTELNRAKLRGRFRQRDETLPALAEDVERLARLAYPDAPNSMITILAMEQFIDALQDDDTKLRIRQLRPATLQQALETALEMESYYLAGRQRKSVREARLESPPRRQQQQHNGRGNFSESKVLEKLQECMEVFQNCMGERGLSPRAGRFQSSRRNQLICWGCKQRGHFRWECPNQKQVGGTEKRESRLASTPPPSGNER